MNEQCLMTAKEIISHFDWTCSPYDLYSLDRGREQWDYISAYPYVPGHLRIVDRESQPSLSEDFIREFRGYVSWYFISGCQILSESFIEEFKHSVFWELISAYQVLSEDFIRKHQNSVSWSFISARQYMSNKFIVEFQHEIWFSNLFMDPKCEYRLMTLKDEHVSNEYDRDWWKVFPLERNNPESIIPLIQQKFINWWKIFDMKPPYPFSDKFLLDYAEHVRRYGTEELEERLKVIENMVIDRTYDIIL